MSPGGPYHARVLIATLLVLTLAQTPQHRLFQQPNLPRGGLAFFEAFNGMGTTTACSSSPPTGARGEVLSYSGTGAKTCTKGANGLRATAITDGDLVSLTTLPRVELDADGVAGLLVESSGVTLNLRARTQCNAAWSDVGTPSCVADQAPGPWGTTTMAQFTDNDAVAKEGRSQAFATTSATQFTAFCYVKAGTATSATIILAGTGSATGDCTATKTGLSTTTSDIIECTSSAAFAGTLTAVTASILVGSVVGTTGTLFVEGCDVKASAPYRTSLNETVAAQVTRAAEIPYFSVTTPAPTACVAATRTGPAVAAQSGGFVFTQNAGVSGTYGMGVYFQAGSRRGLIVASLTTPAGAPSSPSRAWASWNGTTHTVNFDGTAASTTPAETLVARNSITIGVDNSAAAGFWADGIISRVVVDPSITRCSQ